MEEARKLEIVVISAEQLNCQTGGSRFFKHNTFVIVRSDSCSVRKTRAVNRGGNSPSWNDTLNLSLVPSARLLLVEVHCETVLGDKMVGKAEIPVSDFTGDLTPDSYLHFLSYRLRDKEGEKNGIVNLAVRMDRRVCQIPAARMGRCDFPEVPEYFSRPSLNQIPIGEIGGSCLPVGEERRDREIAVGIPVAYGFPV